MADNKNLEKPGLASRFIFWLGKSVLFGVVGAFLLGLIVYAMQKLQAPLKNVLIDAGISPGTGEKILVILAALFWIIFLGNVIMYFRGVKR